MMNPAPRLRVGISAGVVWLALLASAVSTQAFAQGEKRGGPAGDFDFYVLALSWSPGFCDTADGGRERDQCKDGAGLGFVVHGLWPQNERGFPSECAPAYRTPSRLALDAAKGVFPDEGLARYEWRKHGTCSGKSPTDYFADVRAVRDRIVVPKEFTKPTAEQRFAPLDLERAFVAANPGLRTDMMAVACRSGTLSEVRICLTRDLRGFRTCPQVDRSGCRREVEVPPVR